MSRTSTAGARAGVAARVEGGPVGRSSSSLSSLSHGAVLGGLRGPTPILRSQAHWRVVATCPRCWLTCWGSQGGGGEASSLATRFGQGAREMASLKVSSSLPGQYQCPVADMGLQQRRAQASLVH